MGTPKPTGENNHIVAERVAHKIEEIEKAAERAV
jgi:hypothetical protein